MIYTGDEESAILVFQDTLDSFRELYGTDHHLYALTLNDYANLLQNRGRFEEAEQHYQTSLKINLKTYGIYHQETFAIYVNLAQLFLNKNDRSQALKYYEIAADICNYDVNVNLRNAFVVYCTFEVLLQEVGRISDARAVSKKLMVSFSECLNSNDQHFQNFLLNLALGLKADSELDISFSICSHLLLLQEGFDGPHDKTIIVTLLHLAGLHLAFGDESAANKLFKKAVKIVDNNGGDRHPHAASLFALYGSFLLNSGRTSLALSILSRGILVMNDDWDKYGHDAVVTLRNMGLAQYKLGNPLEALHFVERSCEIYEAKLGLSDPITIATRDDLALLLFELGNSMRSKELWSQNLDSLSLLFGEDHPHTQEALKNFTARFSEEDVVRNISI